MLDKVTGIDANTVAMIPMGVFAITGVITASDLQKINWSVIWMVAGGFALGLGLKDSGLADVAIEAIPFGEWSPLMIILIKPYMLFAIELYFQHSHCRAACSYSCNSLYRHGRHA